VPHFCRVFCGRSGDFLCAQRRTLSFRPRAKRRAEEPDSIKGQMHQLHCRCSSPQNNRDNIIQCPSKNSATRWKKPARRKVSPTPSPASGGTRKATGRALTSPPSKTKAHTARGFTPTCIAKKETPPTQPIGMEERASRSARSRSNRNGNRLRKRRSRRAAELDRFTEIGVPWR